MGSPRAAPGWFSFAAVAATLASTPAGAVGDRALGEHLASECTSCHQLSGREAGGIPAIVGVAPDQFVALMGAYKDQQRESQVMRAIAGRLTQNEIEALAAYFGSLRPSP
jgi:cytochrome c553